MLVIIIIIYTTLSIWVCLSVRSINNPVAITLFPFVMAGIVVQWDPISSGFPSFTDPLSFLALLAYGIVMVIPYIAYSRKLGKMRIKKFDIRKSTINMDHLYQLSVFLILSGLVGYLFKLLRLLREQDLPLTLNAISMLFSQNFYFVEAEAGKGLSTLHYVGILGLVYAAIILGAQVERTSVFKKYFLISLVIIYLVSQLGIGVKVGFVTSFLIFLSALSTCKGRVPVFFLGLSGFFVAAVVVINNFVYSKDFSTALNYLSLYVGGPLIGLGKYLNSNVLDHTFAAETLNFIYQIIYKLGLYDLSDYSRYNVFFTITNKGGTGNVGTFIRDPFLDFGIIGMAAYLMGWSLATFFIFKKVSNSNSSVFIILLYSILSASLFMAFFGNILFNNRFLIMVIIHLICHKYLHCGSIRFFGNSGRLGQLKGYTA